MQDRIETERLILRPFEASDAGAAFGWFGDPVVMRFTPTGPDKNFEETEARLRLFMDHQKAHGFSKWLISDRTSRSAIGDSGLLVLEEYGWIDLGFRFAQPYWGKGLAAEVATAWVRAALDELKLVRLGAFAHPENRASIRVLEKLGFHAERRETVFGMDSIVFTSTRVPVRGGPRRSRLKAPVHRAGAPYRKCANVEQLVRGELKPMPKT